MMAPPTDGSEDLVLILSACKFLDLVLVLQTEEFQVYVMRINLMYSRDH